MIMMGNRDISTIVSEIKYRLDQIDVDEVRISN